MFPCLGDKIGMANLVHGYNIFTSDGPNMSTKGEGKKSMKLKANEIVLQVSTITVEKGFTIAFRNIISSALYVVHTFSGSLARNS